MQLVRAAVFVACAVAIFAAAKTASLPVAWVLALVCLGGAKPTARQAQRFVFRRSFARVRALVDREDFASAHAVIAEIREVTPTEAMRLYEGTILSRERRHADAIRMYESIDRRRLQKNAVPWLLNNLAWALARSGQGARAVAVARESIESAGDAGPRPFFKDDLRACQLGTLGAALVVAGQPADALDPLEQALARGGTPQQRAARDFYRGEALQALGRHDDARSAWKRAVETCAKCEVGELARERLDAPAPPYRS